jgi:hypothetical protein
MRVSFDVVVFGTLRFPRGKFAAWKKSDVDLNAPRALVNLFPNKQKKLPPVQVSSLIRDLQASTGHGLFSIEEHDKQVQVRARVSHAAFEARAREIAGLFLSARTALAEGDICMLGEGVFLGYGISLAGGSADLLKLSEEEIQNASLAPELDAISGYFTLAPPASGKSTKTQEIPSTPKPDLLELPRTKRPV